GVEVLKVAKIECCRACGKTLVIRRLRHAERTDLRGRARSGINGIEEKRRIRLDVGSRRPARGVEPRSRGAETPIDDGARSHRVQGTAFRIHCVECSARKAGRVKRAADFSQSGGKLGKILDCAENHTCSRTQIDRAELPPVNKIRLVLRS